jgi:hypothetical protein
MTFEIRNPMYKIRFGNKQEAKTQKSCFFKLSRLIFLPVLNIGFILNVLNELLARLSNS